MVGRKDKFIIFLTLCLSLLALLLKSSPFPIYSATNVLGRKTEWQISQEKATQIAEKQAEVKKLLRRGEVREETDHSITIRQPELNLKSPPTAEAPYWHFELIERIITIPKTEVPSEQVEIIETILIDPFSGRLV